MAAALRRGIAHYADGTSNAGGSVQLPPPVPGDPNSAFSNTNNSVPPPVNTPPVTRDMAAPQGGVGELLRGVGSALYSTLPFVGPTDPGAPEAHFKAAAEGSQSSPATAAIGSALDWATRVNRAGNLASGPSAADWLTNLFAGNPKSTAALIEQHQTAQALRDPKVQSYVIDNPDVLEKAEKDPKAFAAVTQTPEFQQHLQTAATTSEAVKNDASVPDEHKDKVAAVLTNNPDVATSHALAAVAGHQMTQEEFMAATEGLTTRAWNRLFGAQLGHVITPEEKASGEYFDRLHQMLAEATKKRQDLQDADEAAAKKGGVRTNAQTSWFGYGKSPIQLAQEEEQARLKDIMSALAARVGVTQKPYPFAPIQ